MEKEPKIVVIGGGSGISVVLRGLKYLPVDLTAIVTVADDGGSSGFLRKEFDMPAPGDLRNVMVALSNVEPLTEEVFQYRFNYRRTPFRESFNNSYERVNWRYKDSSR